MDEDCMAVYRCRWNQRDCRCSGNFVLGRLKNHTSLFEYAFVHVTNRFRVSTLLKVLTLALCFIFKSTFTFGRSGVRESYS